MWKKYLVGIAGKINEKLGYRVLLVDGDESNIGLENLTGIAGPKHLMDFWAGKKDLNQN